MVKNLPLFDNNLRFNVKEFEMRVFINEGVLIVCDYPNYVNVNSI